MEGEIGSDDSVQILKSPPAIPRMVYDNMPNHVGSKPNLDKPLSRFILSPTSIFLNKEAQVKFDNLRSEQEMSPNTLVRRGIETRRSPRLTLVTESQKVKLAEEIAHRAIKKIGQMTALQVCFNESFDKDSFMAGLIEDTRYTRMMVEIKRKVSSLTKSNLDLVHVLFH